MQDYKAKLDANSYYHIYNRANGKDKLFLTDDNYKFFLQKYDMYISPIAETLSYCLMPNHFHFLIKIKSDATLTALSGFKTLTGQNLSNKLSQQFSHLFNSYTQSFNKQHNRSGSLFARPFNRIKISSEEYLINIVNYIHQNPVTHNYVNEIDDWTYSSYTSFLNNKSTKVNIEEILNLFNDIDNFIYFHNYKKAEKLAVDMQLSY